MASFLTKVRRGHHIAISAYRLADHFISKSDWLIVLALSYLSVCFNEPLYSPANEISDLLVGLWDIECGTLSRCLSEIICWSFSTFNMILMDKLYLFSLSSNTLYLISKHRSQMLHLSTVKRISWFPWLTCVLNAQLTVTCLMITVVINLCFAMLCIKMLSAVIYMELLFHRVALFARAQLCANEHFIQDDLCFSFVWHSIIYAFWKSWILFTVLQMVM